MKRDMDLVRDILLDVEAANKPSMSNLLMAIGQSDENAIKLSYHLTMLIEQAQYLTGTKRMNVSSAVGTEWLFLELTWQGHDFLDDTRDSEVWKKTKTGIEKLGGAGWDVVRSVAVAYAKQKAKEVLGLDLG